MEKLKKWMTLLRNRKKKKHSLRRKGLWKHRPFCFFFLIDILKGDRMLDKEQVESKLRDLLTYATKYFKEDMEKAENPTPVECIKHWYDGYFAAIKDVFDILKGE